MAAIKFKNQDIDKFNDTINNVLHNDTCRQIYGNYLKKLSPSNYNAFILWEHVYNKEFDEELLLDMIEEIDEFNSYPLLTMAERDQKQMYIKRECCRILEKTRVNFVTYLRDQHM